MLIIFTIFDFASRFCRTCFVVIKRICAVIVLFYTVDFTFDWYFIYLYTCKVIFECKKIFDRCLYKSGIIIFYLFNTTFFKLFCLQPYSFSHLSLGCFLTVGVSIFLLPAR